MSYEVSSFDLDLEPVYKNFWFTVRALNGPIGARTARGEPDPNDEK